MKRLELLGKRYLGYQARMAVGAFVLMLVVGAAYGWLSALLPQVNGDLATASLLCGSYGIMGATSGAWMAAGKRARPGMRVEQRTLEEPAVALAVAAVPWVITCVSAAVCVLQNGGSVLQSEGTACTVFIVLHLSFVGATFISALSSVPWFVYGVPLLFRTALLVSFVMAAARRGGWAWLKRACKWLVPLLACGVAALITGGAAYIRHQAYMLPPSYGFDYGGGYSSVDLEPYYPTNEANILPRLESSYIIENVADCPVMDGAEAAYPVYAAFMVNCCPGVAEVDHAKETNPVQFTNTIYAFERLVEGRADIFFGAMPSAAQRKLAEEAGVELVLTPIGQEAFVFFVQADNPVSGLTTEEIRDVYAGRITDWASLGGQPGRVLAFQRPENSGSQTLLQKIMGDTPIMEPLKETYALSMVGIIEQTASYREMDGAIGYTFRFFLQGMQKEQASRVKMLAIDGVYPDTESIQSGAYPFTTKLYAIHVKGNERVPQAFLDWMQGPEGQEIVGAIGYVPLK